MKLVFILSTFIAYTIAKKKAKSVSTVIDAKWEVTPLHLEMSEFLWDESPSTFWNFVDAISALDPPLYEETNERAKYEKAIDLTSAFLSQQQISLMKFSISLHIYSPRVEMFNQIARDKKIICPTAAIVADTIVCSSDVLSGAITKAKALGAPSEEEVLHVDHSYPAKNNATTVILYGELGTRDFSVFHNILKTHADKGEIMYILRHWVKDRASKKLRLSGYGVELQMKSTEYKVQDDTKVEAGLSEESSEDEEEEVEGFNFSKLRQLYKGKIKELEALRSELVESSNELAPLKVWDFQELSLQAAQRIMSAPKEEALHMMIHIASNFPTQARSLVKTVVSPELKSEAKNNQERFSNTLHLQPSDAALFLNGMYFDMEIQDIFSLLQQIRQELKIMEGLAQIGLGEKKILSSLIGVDVSGSGAASDYALDIRDSAVFWLNDIESDKQYKRWSPSLHDLLRPTFPGMLRSLKKNLYNLVILGDPSKKNVEPLLKLAQSFLVHNAPLRLGLVFAVNPAKTALEDPGVALLHAYNYVIEIKDPSAAINFITDVYAYAGDREMTVDDIKSQLKSSFPGVRIDEVLGPDSDYGTGLGLATDFIQRSGLRNMPQVLLNGVPLPEKSLNSEEFEEAVLTEIMNQTPMIQKAIYKGELTDKENVIDFLMTRPNVMPRLNERVLSSSKNDYVDLTGTSSELVSRMIENHLFYATMKSSQKKLSLVTYWIVGDLGCPLSRELLSNAISHMQNSGSIRLSLLVNSKDTENIHVLNRLALAILRDLAPDQATKKLSQLLKNWEEVEKGNVKPSDYGIKEGFEKEIDETLAAHVEFIKDVIKLAPGERGVVCHGRLLGPLQPTETFTVGDFNLLERFTLTAHVDIIYAAISKNSDIPDLLTSDVLMKTVALLASRSESKNRFDIIPVGEEHSVLKVPAQLKDVPAFDVVAIVDPVSPGAHKLASILSVIHQVVNADIRVFLNCVEKNSDMPLKSFYRYVLEPEIHFNSDGSSGPGPVARFSSMPGAPLLTQNMLVPDNWFVESIASPHDLDNIRLDQVDSNVHSQFELEYLIVDGHCYDAAVGSPPRGLQLTLGTDSQPAQFDTIVMANLGYFQLKANPGAWILNLRHGRSTELYDIVGGTHEGRSLDKKGNELRILVDSLRAHTVKLKVTKKPEKAGMDLLSDDNEESNNGLWGSIASTFGSSKEESKDPQDDTINIFSLASGHLYERFLRIMMLSVVKHTHSPVKFWFLKNYLSPTFKDFLPRMAQKYGFKYELVQYKWPRWLHQQTEKQRIIWGYKILFLDVLFPLDVKKIIFVDADQVVRTDMKELVDFDLGGAPYGYTPFCDSRKEMDGFRFWKSGYWKNHLQGRKYHISALYVVDLKRFRRVAAGDRLRGQYQALSQDPSSLSNLDQDLPNNMIHQVSIKSLPQEWLWCETWCDDSSKTYAKTIDLCNNPMTKEAKLTAALRIVPEWKSYDDEIKKFQLMLGETDDHEEEHPHSTPSDRHHHIEL